MRLLLLITFFKKYVLLHFNIFRNKFEILNKKVKFHLGQLCAPL